MKLLFMLPLLIVSFTTLARPGLVMDRIINTCGIPPKDSVDVSSDGIVDLVLVGMADGST